MLKTKIFATLDSAVTGFHGLEALAHPAPGPRVATTPRPSMAVDDSSPSTVRDDAVSDEQPNHKTEALPAPPTPPVAAHPRSPFEAWKRTARGRDLAFGNRPDIGRGLPDATPESLRAKASERFQTSLVPVEQLLARHGLEGIQTTAREGAAQHARSESGKSLGVSKRRVLFATVGASLLMVVAAAMHASSRGSTDASRISPKEPRWEQPVSNRENDAPPRAAQTAISTARHAEGERGVTLERAASDAVIEGRYRAAVEIYDRLAQSTPGRPVYREAARILSERQTEVPRPE